MSRIDARVLIVGVGGLGCAAALGLAHAGIGVLGLCDDDVVDRSNLHRQILYGDRDVGGAKLVAAARALQSFAGLSVRLHRLRLLPENALALVREYDFVVEGCDNFATKFLAADACALARVPIVHASAVRWVGTTLAVGRRGKPCYRCLFEDLPEGDAPNCSGAGVVGPVVGVIAAAQVDLVLGMVDGVPVEGRLVTFDGRTDAMRRLDLAPRADCALCGATARIHRIEPETYVPRPQRAG